MQGSIVFTLILLLTVCQAQNLIVQTRQGLIRGLTDTDRDGNGIFKFMGIPYALPPTGNLRFRSPVPGGGWEGIRESQENVPMCIQFSWTGGATSENCLFLHVYTPELPSEDFVPKAVMVFVHGGGFTGGSPVEGPKHLLTKDVVLVTMQYRVGIFGSFSIDDANLGVPGNAGMKDQQLAIRWVQENIAAFGGDPNNVLIFGDSAGAASVHLQVLSPMNAGLIHKAICESGVALFDLMNGVRNNGILLAEQLGIQSQNFGQMLQSLQQAGVWDIFFAEMALTQNHPRISTPLVEMPSNEPAFLPARPIDLIQSGNYNQIPFMIGHNSAEGLMFQISSRLMTGQNLFITDFTGFIPPDLEIESGSEEETIIANRIKEFYYGDTEPSRDDFSQAVQLYTDFSFAYPSYRSAVEHRKTAENPLFFYFFSADTLLNIFKRQEETAAAFPGASHSDEKGYLFDYDNTPEIIDGSVEDLAIERLVTLWTNFAKTSNPTPTDEGVVWAPIDEENFYYYHFDSYESSLNVGPPNAENMQFWQQLYDEFYPGNVQDPIVQIPQGILRGTRDVNRFGEEYNVFTNIPFGKPPIGDLRFKAPVPADGWQGVRDAGNGDIPLCFQFSFAGGPGSEDCLYLNVYTPEIPTADSTPKPVMVFIHGGGFTGGQPDIGAGNLLTRDIVLVGLAYRLGIFGAFSIDDPNLGVPGNPGMKDQALGIKWVYDNIAYFGGDPNNILIFGDSAGGASVHLQVLSPMNAGLLSKAISQSGVALFDLMNGPRNNGILLAQQLGIQTQNLPEMLRSLQNVPPLDIFIAEQILSFQVPRLVAPLVERPSNEPAFLPEEVITMIQTGNYNQIPYVIGHNNAEGLMIQIAIKQITGQNIVIQDFTGFIPPDLEIESGSEEETIIANRIRAFYYNDTEPSPDDITQAVQLYTDYMFGFPSYRAAKEHVLTATQPIYFYYFSADTLLNIHKRVEEVAANFPGASHTDELGYLLSGEHTDLATGGNVEELALERVVSLWTNFAIYGNPTPTDEGSVWSPLTEDTFNYFHIDTYESTAKTDINPENMRFWEQLYEDFYPANRK